MKKYTVRYTFLAAVLLLLCLQVSAQTGDRPGKPGRQGSIWDRIDFGGSFGAQFGTFTYVDVSPLARYHVTEKLYTGLGLTYMYFKDKRYTPSISLSSYGGSLFAGYYVWRDLFAHLEYAPLYIPRYYDYYAPPFPSVDPPSPWAHDLLIGAGYRQWMGDKAFVNLMVLFNVNETIYSPYVNPIIRIGFGIGF